MVVTKLSTAAVVYPASASISGMVRTVSSSNSLFSLGKHQSVPTIPWVTGCRPENMDVYAGTVCAHSLMQFQKTVPSAASASMFGLVRLGYP